MTNQNIQAIGGGLVALGIIGMLYTLWSITQGKGIDYARPYLVGSVFAFIIGALFWYSSKPKSRE